MKEFMVKFTIFDKKLKVRVTAESEIDALEQVKSAIEIIGIEVAPPEQPKKEEKKSKIDYGNVEDMFKNPDKYMKDLLDSLGKKK